ncbi:MAG: DHH family phosphoesterase, partial [Muribaculaceae bacterium]|nr:DHH family phosphoesterase [Muribaculaceae bacterium]
MIHLDENTAIRLRSLIDGAQNIVITAHMSPDGDAMGSSLGLRSVLLSMGKIATVVVPDDITRQLSFLPGYKEAVVFCRDKAKATGIISSADLIFCLDFNDLHRIDQLAPAVESTQAPKVMIDHHLNPSDQCDLTISYPDHSSTCMLLYEVLTAIGLGDKIGKDAANCILAGMMTDTGNFSYNANDPHIYPIVGELIGKGAEKNTLKKRLFDKFSESHLSI